VLCYDWPVPFRADHGLQPLDLMVIGWIRSKDNHSLSDLSWSFGSRSDGEKGRRGVHLGFRRGSSARRAGGELWRRFGDF
jgi:hypothetical protein